MKFDLILKGGRVFDPVHHRDKCLDIGIREGKIASLEDTLDGADEIIDISNLTAVPGVIDMHVHVTRLLGGLVGYYMAAKTGVTTIIDYAGPVMDITSNLALYGCGMNVGCIDAVLPDKLGRDPSRTQIKAFLDESLANGSLGLKILGGHYPLTPESSRICVEEANKRQVLVACHAGSTKNRSDIFGLEEAVEFAKGQRLFMAHINAYCRGNRYSYLEELRDAFKLLRENPNIISDSHMSVGNGTSGLCREGVPCDAITVNCLKMFGYEPTEEGLLAAMLAGKVYAIAELEKENVLLEKEEAAAYWKQKGKNINVSFPANLASVAAACVTERLAFGGSFLIEMAATDGGGFPRNGLIQKLLSFYRLGYLSLAEVVEKCSVNPAAAFGLTGKGHLGPGADADITLLDMERLEAVMSFAAGKRILDHEKVVGTGGTFLTTEIGMKKAREKGLCCRMVNTAGSSLYGKREERSGFSGKNTTGTLKG